MARRGRKRRSSRAYVLFFLLLLLSGAGTYYRVFWKPIRDAAPTASPPRENRPPPRLISERPADGGLAGGSDRAAADHPAPTASGPTVAPGPKDYSRAVALRKTGFAAHDRGETLEARTKLSEALASGLPPEDLAKTRTTLSQLADQTIFSATITPDDPLVSAYVIQPGEVLAKIAARYDVTSALLARINHLPDVNRVRAGQRIKVPQGPFHAVIQRDTFDMDVFLQTTLVKHFKIGLGQNDSTPAGKWQVRDKLLNPTYYPPRGGDIIAADDPKNPLGERWIGLLGVEGDAVGQVRYGIHGTIEPESIGQNMSLGCIRLPNPDVEFLFDLLVEGKSTVLVR